MMFSKTCTILTVLVLLLGALGASGARAAVEPTSGRYVATVTDLAVQVPGRPVEWRREWRDGLWRFNRRWADLALEHDPLDGSVRRIRRNEDVYERIDAAGTRFGFGPRLRIRTTETGFRWTNREGEWIEYDESGRILRFGARERITIVLVRDEEGALAFVEDELGRMLYTIERDEAGRIGRVVDRAGREVSYAYASGQLIQVTDVRGHAWQYGYSGDLLITMTDPRGHVTEIAYTADGRVRSLQRPGEAATTYLFDYLDAQRQYYLRTQRPGGEIVEAFYHRDGELLRRDIDGTTVLKVERDGRRRIHIDFNGHRTIHHYDEFRNLTGITWPDGTSRVSEYEHTFSQVTRQIDEAGIITRHEYDGQGRRVRTIEAAGTGLERVVEFDYDGFGQVVEIRRPGDDPTDTAVTTLDFDEWGNAAVVTDPEGGTVTYTFDVMGNVLDRTDPLDRTWSRTRDAAGLLLTETDPLNHTTTHVYDELGNRIRTTHPDGAVTTFEYDAAGRLVTHTDALDGEQVYEYDAAGNRTRETDPAGKTTRYEYDASRRLIKLIDGADNQIVFHYPAGPGELNGDRHQPVKIVYPTFERGLQYDRRGRVIAQTDRWPEGTTFVEQTTRTEYDARGFESKTVDIAGRETNYAYDGLGRLTAVTDALDQTTTYHYDHRDNLTGLTDANGNTHVFTFDQADRMLTEARPMGQTITYVYDDAGQLVERIDPVGHRAEYDYDAAGRRINISHFHADDPAVPDKVVSFSYDARGRLTGYEDGFSGGEYTYDALGRKTAETLTLGGVDITHTQTWHANGRMASLTAPDGISYGFSWDSADRMQSVTVPGEGVIAYGDYDWQQPKTIQFPGGTTRTQRFDGLQRHQSIRVTNQAAQTLMDYAYTWDATGNITEKATEHGDYVYAYDAIDRLVEAGYPTLSPEQWAYDPLGNRITDARTGQNLWQYNENNELLSSVEFSYEYDANGSLIAEYHPDGSLHRTFKYNSENRLAAVRDATGALIAEYRYDPFGSRTQSQVYDPPGNTTAEITWFVYTDQGLMAELDRQGNQKHFYLFPPDGLWSTDPILRRDGSTTFYYQTDHLGTPQQLVDPTGALVHTREMRAFGETLEQGLSDGWRFPGQLHSAEMGLHYNYFRDYEPATGRYVQRDPIGVEDGPNPYAFVGNNPLIFFDPDGLAKICCRILSWARYFYHDPFGIPPVLGPRHCYIVSNSGTTFSLFPKRKRGQTFGDKRLDDDRDRDSGGICKPCPRKCGEDQDECFREQHNKYPVGQYKLFGPNSNTYAGTLAKACCEGGIPGGLGFTPGISDSPPPPSAGGR